MYNELSDAQLMEGEQGKVEQTLEKINNIETIKSSLSEIQELIEREDFGVLDTLNKVIGNLQNIVRFSEDYQKLHDRFTSIKIELDDLQNEMQTLL